MKKYIILLVLVLTVGLAVGCQGTKTPGNENSDAIVLLNSFENKSQLETTLLYGVLGKIELNDDKQFVSDGESSVRVTVIAKPYKSGAPYLFQALSLQHANADYTDFSQAGYITADVFNVQQTPSRIGVQLSYGKTDGQRKYFDLEPLSMTTIRFAVEREFIPPVRTASNTEILFVEGIKLHFDRAAEDCVYYVDNLRLYNTESSFSPVEMSLNENEICSFDRAWQTKLLELESGGLDTLMPEVSIVSNITSTGQGSAVRVDAPPGMGEYQATNRWPGLGLNQDMLALFPFSAYPPSARLCFDVYAPQTNGVDEVWLSAYSSKVRYFAAEAVTLTPGKWVTVSYTVAQMNAELNSEDYCFKNTTQLVLRYGEHAGPGRIFYVDNFRMEL